MNIKQKLALIRVMLYFNAILRKGKISKAAEENGIKQGNLSHLITDFEKSSGILLLQRSNQGVIPTPRGLKISRLTEQLEQSLRELEKAVHPEPRGSIKFCLAPDLNLKNLSQFQKQHPSWETKPLPGSRKRRYCRFDPSAGLEMRIHDLLDRRQRFSEIMDSLSDGQTRSRYLVRFYNTAVAFLI